MTASHTFEDRLLEQLRQIVAEQPAPAIHPRRRPRGTRLALAGAGVVAASATVAVIATSGDVTPSAYAVQSLRSGAVTVSIRSLRDADGLQRSLRAAGVPAVVSYVPLSQADCAAPGRLPGGAPPPSLQTSRAGGDTGPSFSKGGSGEAAPKGDARRMKGSVMKVAGDGGGVTFTIDPGTLKPGEKVYITTSTGAVDSIGMSIGTVKPAGPCSPAPPTP